MKTSIASCFILLAAIQTFAPAPASAADFSCAELLRKEFFDAAIAACSEEMKSDTNRYIPLVNRGTAYQMKAMYAEALADFSDAIALEPKRAKAYMKRGLLQCFQNNYAEAQQDVFRAAEIEPSAASFMAIVEVYALQNKTDDACRWLRRTVETGSRPLDYVTTEKASRSIRNSSCYKDIIAGN